MSPVWIAALVVAAVLHVWSAPGLAGERTPLVNGMRDGGRIAVGGAHSCVLGADGRVLCWGENGSGQLGDGTVTTPRRTPVLVANLTQVVAIAAGAEHTCAVRANGQVFCWGSSSRDQIGPNTSNRSTPIQVAGLVDMVAITAGARHTCALSARGVVHCWGDNTQGQLGRSGTGTAPVDLDDVVAIGAGAEHTCAVDVQGDAFCWGRNNDGQLGAGDDAGLFESLPVPVRFSGTTLPGIAGSGFVAITGGTAHTCGLRATGRAMCWGSAAFGQIGDGGTTPRNNPQEVTNVADAISVAAGGEFGCAIRVGGTARCWGRGGDGQLGNNATGDRFASVTVANLTNALQVAAGRSHACALRVDGTVHCWGDNTSGQIGDNTLSDRNRPTPVTGVAGGIGARQIATHGSHVCGLRGFGTVMCWGGNASGQLGDGTTTSRPSPTPVAGLGGVASLAVGGAHTCARMGDGTVRCWGRNLDGQLGDGTTTNRPAPVAVPGLTDVVAVATGGNHSCALRVGGSVQCWGDNQFGQLGDLTTTDSPTPRGVLINTATPSFLTGAVAIAAGTFSTCVRTVDGGVRCWGRNNVGQLGINSTAEFQTSPRGALISDVVALAVANHGCFVRSVGTLLCTGGNASGQIGDGTTTTRLFPNTAIGISTALSVATGAFHTCAIRGSGQALCWGDNSAGQFGDGTTTSRLTPGVGPALGSLTAITAGGFHTCALDGAGQVFCWGQGGTGVLGDGTFGDHLTPVAVPSFSFNIDPGAQLTRGRAVEVTALAACPEGARVHLRVRLTQDGSVGHGNAVEACTGALARYPLLVHPQGRDWFEAGPAEAEAEAVVRRRNQVIDVQEWTRNVTIEAKP